MAPKVIRRLAALPRRAGVLRRPAAAEDGGRGDIPALSEELRVGDIIHGEDCSYYGTPCQISGKVVEVWKDLSGSYYNVRLYGTNAENLLTWASGSTDLARIHLCSPECGQESVGPGLLHCMKHRGLRFGGDSRPALERRPTECRPQGGGRARRTLWSPQRPFQGGSERGGKGKEKEEKGKGKEEACEEFFQQLKVFEHEFRGEAQSSRAEGYVRGGWPRSPEEGQKSTEEEGAKVCSAHAKPKRGQEQFEQRGDLLEGPGHFWRTPTRSCSGNELSRSSVGSDDREYAGADAGRSWAGVQSTGCLGPYALEILPTDAESASFWLYEHRAARAMYSGRFGQLPEAMDTLTQRVKSLEAQISGLAWTAAQRLELLPTDTPTLSSRQELKIATTEQRAEAQAHQSGSWWSKGSGKESGKSEKADKGKGKGKKGKEKPKKD